MNFRLPVVVQAALVMPPAPVRIPTQRPLASVSRLWANGKKPATVHKSPSIYVTAEANPGLPQLGAHLMKAVRPVIALIVVPYLQMASVRLHNTLRREKEKRS